MTNSPSPSLRAALYARYSTDKQRETSTEDQLREARARCEREGWQIVAVHADEGVSGSVPVARRRGGKALLADMLAGRFEILVLEGLDRLSREIAEAEGVTKRMEHRGIRIVGTADGYDSEARGRKVMRIARGLVNELYLDDLREKTHRGLAGQFDRGFHVGGLSYGYRSEPGEGDKGRHLVIDEAQAAIVREVFQLFADGHSARSIVHQLNARGIVSARGGSWAVSALFGDSKRGAGMLNNETYIGRLVWNRRQWLKDPDTGKRRYVDRPKSEWQVREVPELRIVPAELWDAARSRARTGPARGSRLGKGASPRTLFGGLLRCPACGGPMVAIDARRYGCNRRNDRGATECSNADGFPRHAVDGALLAMVREELLSPAAQAELQRVVRLLLAEHARGSRNQTDAARQRLQVVESEIARLVDAVAAVGISAALGERLAAAERERDALQGQLGALGHPQETPRAEMVMAAYKRQLLTLRDALEADADRARTRALLADLIGPVTLMRDGGGSWAEMEEPAQRMLVAGSSPMAVVAGARYASRKRVRIA